MFSPWFKRRLGFQPQGGYSAANNPPPGARPPRATGVPPLPEPGRDFAAGALNVMEYFQAERDAAIRERDEARRMARKILRGARYDPQGWQQECPWLAEEDD